MKLTLIRHAPAGDHRTWALTGRPDETRPLSDKGSTKMRKAARGLARIAEPPERLFSSPLLRARQTAEIVLEQFPGLHLEIGSDLEPEAEPAATLSWLRSLAGVERVALVGHEPHISALAALLVHGDATRETLPFRKGGTAILELASIEPGKATLVAFLSPRILRALGES